jgi:hypothetical protein
MASLLGQTLNIPNLKVGQSKTVGGRAVGLQYPANLGDYHMILNFKQYDYSSATSNSQGRLVDSIALPLPANLVDSSRIELGGKQIGSMGQLAASTYDIVANQLGGMQITGVEDLLGAMGNQLSNAAGAATSGIGRGVEAAQNLGVAGSLDALAAQFSGVGAMTTYALRGFADKLAPGVGQGIGAAVGNTLNPHATLVFDGVDLKIHNFEWQFAPKNEQESDTLTKVIEKIQYHIHPEYKSIASSPTGFAPIDRGLLSYPSLMEIILVCPSASINFMVKFNKYVMVNQFNVDYTPQGISLNRGGRPAMIRCSMNVTESQIRTKADYAGGEPAGIAALNRRAASSAAANDTTEQTAGLVTDEGFEVSAMASGVSARTNEPAPLPEGFPAPGSIATEQQSALLRALGGSYPLPNQPLSETDVLTLEDQQYDPNSDPEINEGP